jgi:hypothetical protein
MKKLSQSGFAAVETVLLVVIVAAIAGIGYYVWHTHNNVDKLTSTSETPDTINSVSTPKAPQINKASDLNRAIQVLNRTDVTASNTDSSQLSTETSGL